MEPRTTRSSHNPKVGGSNPPPATKKSKYIYIGSGLPSTLAFAVFVVIVFHSSIRESADEFGFRFVRLLGPEQPLINRPFVCSNIDRIQGKRSGQTILQNPRLCDFSTCEYTAWKVPLRSAENPHFGHRQVVHSDSENNKWCG